MKTRGLKHTETYISFGVGSRWTKYDPSTQSQGKVYKVSN